ncbi:MAG: hypothetical protein BYD32DRAFT_426940 [Podila humilis]|nr:MAG: hypothetical protein BYD32DRAFT_426940 [Podila humilis]
MADRISWLTLIATMKRRRGLTVGKGNRGKGRQCNKDLHGVVCWVCVQVRYIFG